MPADSVSSTWTLHIFPDWSHLWWLLYPPVCLLGHFPSLQHVQGNIPPRVFKGGCQPLTHSTLGFPFHFSHFVVSPLTMWWWYGMCCQCHLMRQSSGGHGWLLAPPLSCWKLRPYRLHCLHGWWSHLAWRWSLTLTGWWLSHQCALWNLAVCCFLEWEAWFLILFYLLASLNSAFPSFSSVRKNLVVLVVHD